MSENTLDQVLTLRREANQDIVNVDEPVVKLVFFELSGQRFAFYGNRIREILAQIDVFFVPGCPASLEGVINVRGDIESVIRPHDMLQLPDHTTPESGRASSILLGQGSGIRSGIRVDRVIDVLDVQQSDILPPPASLPDHMRALVIGVLYLDDQAVALLDLDRMFADYARGLG